VTARVQTDVVRSLRHQRRDLHQSTYHIPLRRSGLILLSGEAGSSNAPHGNNNDKNDGDESDDGEEE
jgi:hypothetical protein